ncbi:retropepsin-like aspartic protease [Sphingomonas naphthae]|uniref:Retropepsin-like aspartic protease n=1 Tax=Sphingomonas naphthae TaxID=1813468 RepID=A0ABY7TL03_9SPHN|nr:retropepsin-like aspartic protease [Sphingomonas naphthae]WCT73060.1 retropepsin-like aspartic protease [Sphingomonas naphthae]
MNKDWLAGVMVVAMMQAYGPVGRAEAQPPDATGDAPIRAPSRPVSMPFVLRDNLVTIDTLINNRPQRAVLDSGAGSLVIDRSMVRKLGLGEGTSVGDVAAAGGQTEQLRPIDIESLTVGPLHFAHVAGHSVNLGQLSASAGFPVELLVGAPAFRHGAVTVDYRKRRVTFGPSGSAPACAAPIPLRIVENVPVVDVDVRTTPGAEPVRLKLVVDLGTRHNAMMVGGPFLRSEAGLALMRSGRARKVGHGVGGAVQGNVARIAALQAGAFQAADVEVALTSGAAAFEAGIVDGSLGMPLWGKGVITFDYPARQLCIAR